MEYDDTELDMPDLFHNVPDRVALHDHNPCFMFHSFITPTAYYGDKQQTYAAPSAATETGVDDHHVLAQAMDSLSVGTSLQTPTKQSASTAAAAAEASTNSSAALHPGKHSTFDRTPARRLPRSDPTYGYPRTVWLRSPIQKSRSLPGVLSPRDRCKIAKETSASYRRCRVMELGPPRGELIWPPISPRRRSKL